MQKNVSMAELLPFIEEAFSRNAAFKLAIKGTSMNPLLYQNRDYVLLEKPVFPLSVGDIPLYRRNDGAFVLHRIVSIDEKGYVMCGDNQFILEKGITDENIIGVTSALIINGKEISVSDEEYIEHKNKYLKNLNYRYPIRRARYKLHGIKEKWTRKSGKRLK